MFSPRLQEASEQRAVAEGRREAQVAELRKEPESRNGGGGQVAKRRYKNGENTGKHGKQEK